MTLRDRINNDVIVVAGPDGSAELLPLIPGPSGKRFQNCASTIGSGTGINSANSRPLLSSLLVLSGKSKSGHLQL